MQFLANENMPRAAIAALRLAGHDVVSIGEETPGIPDQTVLARAHAEQRIILTFDRDYGELVFRYGHPAPPGIVFFRFAPATVDEPAPQLLALVADDQILLDGMFTVVDRQHIRQRPLAPPTPAPES